MKKGGGKEESGGVGMAAILLVYVTGYDICVLNAGSSEWVCMSNLYDDQQCTIEYRPVLHK